MQSLFARITVLMCACAYVWHAVNAEPTELARTSVRATMDRSAPALSDSIDSSASPSTLLAGNTVRISDSQIVLAAHDKKALLKAIADAVLARRVKLRSDSDSSSSGSNGDDDDDDDGTATATAQAYTSAVRVPIATSFPVAHSAFLYYVSDPTDASKTTVRIGWRYSLADWKALRALIAPSACEVQRTIGDYYYC